MNNTPSNKESGDLEVGVDEEEEVAEEEEVVVGARVALVKQMMQMNLGTITKRILLLENPKQMKWIKKTFTSTK